MQWPQIAYLVLIGANFGCVLAKHGEPRDGSYNVGITIVSAAIGLFLLWKGGFFVGGVHG